MMNCDAAATIAATNAANANAKASIAADAAARAADDAAKAANDAANAQAEAVASNKKLLDEINKMVKAKQDEINARGQEALENWHWD